MKKVYFEIPWDLLFKSSILVGVIVAIFQPNPNAQISETQKKIDAIFHLLQKTLAEDGELPSRFQDLRILCRNNELASPYDAYGNRLHYTKLNRSHFILKSFGADGMENTVNTPIDIASSNIYPQSQNTWAYSPPKKNFRNIYPASLLLGSKGTKGHLGQLFINPDSTHRFLVVAKATRGFYLVARHNRIEEFFWLENQNQIIYTATNMEQYKDGIYLWDLETNTTKNLLENFHRDGKLSVFLDSQELFFRISLSAIDNQNTIFAYVKTSRRDRFDIEDFFSNKIFYRITIPKKDNGIVQFEQSTEKLTQTWSKLLEPGVNITGLNSGNRTQRSWLNLEKQGDLESVLHTWQEFSIAHAETPIFSYSLWRLINIYSDAYQVLKNIHPKQSEVLRSYGVELSYALANMEIAPTYLRDIGKSFHFKLLNKDKIRNSSKLTINIGPGSNTSKPAGGRKVIDKNQEKIEIKHNRIRVINSNVIRIEE